MAILLTGGAGYIGSHCYYALSALNEDIVVLDDLSKGFRSLLPASACFYEGDAGDPAILAIIFKKHDITTVIHFAGSIVVSESVADPEKYYRNNTVVTLNLLHTCIQHGIKNIIFSSTASVYGNNPKRVMSENDVLAPENPYAMSKMMSEQLIRDFHQAYDINFVILRYFNVAGAVPEGRTGQLTENATHLLKIACEAALGKRKSISIFGTDYNTMDGTCVRDYIHVSDLASAHVSALQYLQKQVRCAETFNCGYGKGYSVNDMLKAVACVSGKALTIHKAARRPGDVEALIADASRLKAKTHWQPEHDSLVEIVRTALAFEKKQLTPEEVD